MTVGLPLDTHHTFGVFSAPIEVTPALLRTAGGTVPEAAASATSAPYTQPEVRLTSGTPSGRRRFSNRKTGEAMLQMQSSPDSAPEPWVGVSEVARHLSCSPRRIYDLTSRKDDRRIPYRKDGSRLLFRLSAVDRWIDTGRAA